MRDRMSASVRYSITEKLNCALSAAYNQSETEGNYRKEKFNYYSARPSLKYIYNEYLSIQMGYLYNRTENEITDRAEKRNRIFVQIDAVSPLHY